MEIEISFMFWTQKVKDELVSFKPQLSFHKFERKNQLTILQITIFPLSLY